MSRTNDAAQPTPSQCLDAEETGVLRAVLQGAEAAESYLLGSRTGTNRCDGDIDVVDLLVETDEAVHNRVKTLCDNVGALARVLGNRKINIRLTDARSPDVPVFPVARCESVRL